MEAVPRGRNRGGAGRQRSRHSVEGSLGDERVQEVTMRRSKGAHTCSVPFVVEVLMSAMHVTAQDRELLKARNL